MRTRYLADRVLPDAKTEIDIGAVIVEGDRIVWVGPACDAPDADETVELGEATLVPGLVNAHTHLDLTHMRGKVPFNGEFTDWIEGVIGGRRDAPIAEAAERGIREALARGTTAFGDIVSKRAFDDVVAAFAATGARARLFVEMVGFKPELAEAAFADAWELAEMRPLPPRVESGFSPHAPYSVSRELFDRAASVADGHGKPLAVHIAETLEELAFIRHGIGPLRELTRRLDADDPGFEPYGTVPDVLERLKVDRAPLLLIHGNYLRPGHVPPGAYVVYCPTAHHFFRHPEHPALELVEEGVRVALGSDSAASGDTVDLLSETQFLGRARLDIDERTVFCMATEWGAAALGFDAGRLESGRLADLAVFTPAAGHEILGRTDARCIYTVVGGDPVFDGRETPA
ncbi:MAG: amidohydrolase family protein [Planctomycetota bacterium]